MTNMTPEELAKSELEKLKKSGELTFQKT